MVIGRMVLSVTILETTKTLRLSATNCLEFYRSQFWRLEKHSLICLNAELRFIGHNFGDYKNQVGNYILSNIVLSVTILETTKTNLLDFITARWFYRSQFWRLQKPQFSKSFHFFVFYRSQFWRLQKPDFCFPRNSPSFIGHNFGDYKNSNGIS